jgi:hypothetical protein
MHGMYPVFANLIVGWRVYDPASIAVDFETGAELDMVRLPSPPTAELVAKLPTAIINRIATEMTQAVNPPSGSVTPTSKTSSSSPSPSTTAPGEEPPSPTNSETSS